MPRTIDLIRASKLPSNMMQFAAKGALQVSADENIEILVYLAKHNKIFGDTARLTLAGWDEKASLAAASDPETPREVLDYFISPENLRSRLLPALLENSSVSDSELARFAISASGESIEAMLRCARVRASAGILTALRANPYLKAEQSSAIAGLLNTSHAETAPIPFAGEVKVDEAAVAAGVEPAHDAGSAIDESGEVPDEAVSSYLAEHVSEIAGSAESVAAESAKAASAPAARSKHGSSQAPPGQRDNAMQKINRLDVKDRIQLALKGNKEERSLLIRDGTKVVALAVLEAPKLSDGEVEKFALQKNVLEAVLRQIPLKRRFMKNYIVVRNLVANPRTPLDLGLGLMKHLMMQDLKNISNNKEISETVRKLALKMYKQKLDAANKK